MRRAAELRRSQACLAIALVTLATLGDTVAHAHPTADRRRAQLSAELSENPCDIPSLLRLGKAEMEEGRWSAAEAAYDRASRCDNGDGRVDRARGELFLAADRLLDASRVLRRHLSRHPNDLDARITYARTLLRRQRPAEAADTYAAAIDALATPQPDHYAEYARAYLESGQWRRALVVLDDGLRRLGPQPALAEMAIDIEAANGRFDKALARLQQTAGRFGRERFELRRAEILERANRTDAAYEAYVLALAALESRPAHRKHTAAMITLEQRLHTALARLDRARIDRARTRQVSLNASSDETEGETSQ